MGDSVEGDPEVRMLTTPELCCAAAVLPDCKGQLHVVCSIDRGEGGEG